MAQTALTVGKLKKIIANLPDDMAVIIQEDSEGNGFRPAYAADPNCIWDQSESHILSTNSTANENCLEEDEWKKMEG
jgi:hypothetical protein